MAGFGLGLSLLAVSGCVSGTTYGTGVSQEEQTVNDLVNMFTLKQKREQIDYSSRPDLIVPEDKIALSEPVDKASTTSNPDWPETPEQRIARIRGAAGEVDARSGDYSIQEQLRRKEGIGIEDSYGTQKRVVGLTDRDGNIVHYRGESSSRKEVLKAKEEMAMSVGASRKFLTEPPVEYRIPVSSAPSGAEAFTEEELLARKKASEKKYQQELKPFQPKE
ncbi:MAG: hypothetical protein WBO55_10875 [Rhizobiaceae bacterium]